jgi:hypothetical protein
LTNHRKLTNLRTVQRLFSMFPAGAPGVGLLLLRASVAATLLVSVTDGWTFVAPFWMLAGMAALTVALSLGFLTPYCSLFCCLLELSALTSPRGTSWFHLLMAIVNNIVLGLLGPGAYSVDSHLFGRRVLQIPARTKTDSD